MEKINIAKEAYRQIVLAIMEIEKNFDINCVLPEFIQVDGERFYKNDLYIFSNKEESWTQKES